MLFFSTYNSQSQSQECKNESMHEKCLKVDCYLRSGSCKALAKSNDAVWFVRPHNLNSSFVRTQLILSFAIISAQLSLAEILDSDRSLREVVRGGEPGVDGVYLVCRQLNPIMHPGDGGRRVGLHVAHHFHRVPKCLRLNLSNMNYEHYVGPT